MPQSEMKILREEIAMLHTQLDDKDEIIRITLDMIEWQRGVILQGELRTAELERKLEQQLGGHSDQCKPETCTHAKESQELQQKMPYYESPFNPSSKNSIPTMQERIAAYIDPKDYNKVGQKENHVGVSQTDKSAGTVPYIDSACPGCHGIDITYNKSYQCRIRDVPLPKTEINTHVGYKHTCNGCGYEWDTSKKIPKIKGTEMSINMLVHHGISLFNNMSQGMIQKQLEFFDYRPSKATINNATFALVNAIEDDVSGIWKAAESSENVKFDETPHKVPGKRGYVWTCVTDDAVLVRVTDTRGSRVLDEYFKPFKNKCKTVDGYCGYETDDDTQRCWSHILIDSKHAMKTALYCHETTILHERLQKIFHIAKGRPPGDVSDLIAQVLDIVDQHEKLGNKKFATTLRNAAPNLFTFVNHPGMDPTNNETELYMRPIAIHRNISLHFTSQRGMDAWSILFTFFFTCRKRGLSIRDELLRILTAKAAEETY